MRVTRCGASRLLGLLLGVAVVACAGSVDQPPAGIDAASIHTIVLLPLNVVAVMPSELKEGAPQVDTAIQAHLEDTERTIVRLSFADAKREWLASTAALRGERESKDPNLDAVARHLAMRLRERQPYDALVFASLVLRRVRIQSRRVSWDGVERRLEVVEEPTGTANVSMSHNFQGEILAPSLAVRVLSSSGELLFDGMGGLDLAHRARMSPGDSRRGTRWTFEVRPDLFSDETLVREGVTIAFRPLVPGDDE